MKKFRPTPMQELMLYEAQNVPGRYVSKLQYALDAPMDAQTLSRRLALMTARHESLRTSFVRDSDGVLWQKVGESDNGHFRVSLTRPNELSVEFHHAVLDGWSVGILMRELLAMKEPDGTASPFRYYAKWLERRSPADDLCWWKSYLDGTGACSELPNKANTNGYERRELRFVFENSELLRKTARELKITAGRLLEAVWCMLIARYNGGDSVVCTVTAGRSAPVPGITEMVGMCVNTLPIVTKLPKPPESTPFADWVHAWSRQKTEAEKYGFCNLGALVSGPLPHILAIDPGFDGEGLRLISSSAELVTDFDAAFTLGDEIKAEFAYNARAYSDEIVKSVHGHFLKALNAVLENPRIPVERVPILKDAEVSRLIARNENADILGIIEHQTIADFWRECVRKNESRTALVCGNVRLTYPELSGRVNKLSAALRTKGVTRETPVAILLPRSEKYIITELAVMMAGGMFIPLDPEWPEHRIQTILTEISPKLVIDEKVYDELIALNCQLSIVNCPLPQDAAYMIMTSGTTGTPKGVVIEHRSLSNFCLWAKERYGWKPGDSSALELGFTFDGSMWDIWLPLISGGTLHILRDDVRFNIGALGNYCRRERITHIDLPVTMAETFREIYSGENALPDLRVMAAGGEEIRRVVPAPYALSNEYGPTECTVCCSVGWLNGGDSPITLGSPPPNMNAYILDEWGRLCPDGVEGEAYFSGVQVARGYYNAPELTAERFTDNPFAGGNTHHRLLYRTGDLMRWIKRDGKRELVFMGRADNQVKVNGFRIELAEIENVLREHSAVNVVNASLRETSAGEKQLCAYVVSKARLDVSELYELIAAKLPSFMRPAIVLVDEIPLTSSGKIDFKRLPLPKTKTTAVTAAPVTINEKILASAVGELLGISDIGINNNYLELGGNSINAMRIAFSLEKEGYELSVKELITSVSLMEAAAKMQSIMPAGVGECRQNTFTPVAAQQAMIFLAKTVSPAMYTVTVTLDAPELDAATLRERLDRAAKLHDILRAAFELNEKGEIVGRIHETHRIRLNSENLNEAGGIDPMQSPLLDLKLHENKLTMRYHHIILDGFSVNMLINELLHGKFPETASSFAEFANRLAAQTERQAKDKEWWREAYQGAKSVQLLPAKTEKEPEYRRISVCSPELLDKCGQAARNSRVTLAAFTLAAWGIVVDTLGAEGGGIVIPFVASCRDDDHLMGMCAQARPLVVRFAGQTFGELALRVQNAMLESVSHWFAPQDIIGKLPDYLFAFEDGAAEFTAGGEQNYDLVIKFSDSGELIYNATRLPEYDAKRIAAYLNEALKAALENRLSLLGDGEYELITETFSRGRTLSVRHQTAVQAFAEAAEIYSEHVALETENEVFTYSELYERAKRLACALNASGVGAGDIAAFCLPRSAEGAIAQLGIALSGAAFLPLDPAWPDGRIADILRDSGAAAVIKDGLTIEHTNAHGKIPNDSAYIIYTSGTTGKPKGVVLTQSALANQIAWTLDEFHFAPGDKMLHYVAFTFDPSVWVIFTTLASGATLSLLPEDIRLDPDACARYIKEKGITICTLPATVAPDILRRVSDSCLRTVFLGGEAIKNLPPQTRDFEIINLYGPTEACINAAFYRLPPIEIETRVIGNPVANTSCYVLDTRGEPSPMGTAGELYLGGVQLAHGYLNRPNESAAVFTKHPRLGRIYKTGDRAAWNNDGTLTFFGRTDNQVKIRGNRVELLEIEHALREIHGIIDAKVKLSEDELCAYIVCEKNAPALSVSGVRERLAERLPSYMLPRSVTVMESFPLTENGKVDFNAFPVAKAISENAEPLTEMENAVARAWKTALGLQDFTIGRGDSFYELGGHSLLLFHVVGLLSAAGISVDIRTLIEHPYLADLAEAISRTKIAYSPKATADCTENVGAYRLYVEKMEKIDLSRKRPFRNILITGGTGFLGSHLIREFYIYTDTVIHLPVRGDITKIQGVLDYYFGGHGAEMAASNRLKVYPSDISEKTPDIDATLDAIFHTAADIRHYAPEPEMYRANVVATENMLELAKRYPGALFSHISTTSAVNSPVIYETDTNSGPEFDNIYQRTKQLAEQRVFDAGKNGLKYAVFRVGHVSPGFESGSVARNWEINAMLRLINAMLLTELLPEQNYKIGYGYVDKTAHAIRLLSTPEKLAGFVFHIDNPNTLRLSELFKLAGLPGTVLPKTKLTARLRRLADSQDAAVRQAAAEYLGRLSQGSLEKDSSDIVAGRLHMNATLLLLKRLGFEWPHVTGEYVGNIIKNLKNKGGKSN